MIGPLRGSEGARRGFTLLEVLVVIVILSVVSGLGTSAFVTITSAWNDQQSMSQLNAMAEDVFSAIATDFSDTLSHDLSGVPISGASRDSVDTRTVPAAHNADDTLVIPIQGAAAGRTRERLATVGYRIDRSAATMPLLRTLGELGDKTPGANGQSLVPGARTLAFRVEYLSEKPGRLWIQEWNGADHPRAVRVSITLQDLNRPDLQLSRKSVMHIHVQ